MATKTHCGRRGCPCTHTEGCDHGWLVGRPRKVAAAGQIKEIERAAPCPTCKPELAERLEREARERALLAQQSFAGM